MSKFTDIFFFDYFEAKKTQTGEEPQYRFDGPRESDLRYYMNRSIFDGFSGILSRLQSAIQITSLNRGSLWSCQMKVYLWTAKSITKYTSAIFPGYKPVSVPVDIMYQIVSINECKNTKILFQVEIFDDSCFKVNLAGEYMDLVLALTIKWEDKRLRWNKYEWGTLLSLPVNTIQVSSDEIWTPGTDFYTGIFWYLGTLYHGYRIKTGDTVPWVPVLALRTLSKVSKNFQYHHGPWFMETPGAV